ncbi:uncharacterized protein LOC121267163 [Juglans microcarpa x Juglans regia]|uniref:uncharacterized protein LOC121267163 n=1 Tax=Juglans microcarpa x Juglans regia TaxID=2249226 RepID=UPI001B7ED273|nr:uncharacterized protein LOC121267163 [Juglans microcarpa x Juglans regia]
MDPDADISHVDREIWVDGMEDVFIDMMLADALNGALRAGRITSRDHASYAARLTAVGVKTYDASQIKGKIHRLKMMQRLFTDLMHQTGMGWDPDTKTVLGSDEHWANAIRAKPQVKKFRTSGCPRYADLCTIFGAAVATGTLHHASTQPPPSSDEEERLDAEMRRRGPALGTQASRDFVFDGPSQFPMDMGTPSSCSSRRRQKGGQKNQHDEKISNMVDAITRSYEARRKCYEGRGEASGEKRSRGSTHCMDSDDGFDAFSHCVALLQALQPPLPDDIFSRAFDRLMNPLAQRGFLVSWTSLEDVHVFIISFQL